MENVIIIAILVLIVAGIVWYLSRAKKRGETCIGCPYSKNCNGSCGSHQNKK
ncbi:MAG: FeoB-associated Cys-rich membrane protein [Clostridia bacterium]|nr:FeoB-associated Cys-rich membrane protein [Clostridia bacterium]